MIPSQPPTSIAVLTSGGDAPGMNAAVRAVVRMGLYRGVNVFAVYEGYRGMVEGGDRIRPMTWDSVGGILHQGGTIIGSARCPEFLERDGRRQAARNLIERDIDSLVVIGGDGSLTGANLFREEWPGLVVELVERGEITRAAADAHPALKLVGLVGSIDNDMFGTDMTIGADTALHRITEAIDAISSTASSHQRTFVVEVMGRHCGYLALMSAIATGANWVLIPEYPPDTDDWEEEMARTIQSGRDLGRRHSIVIVAEGARDRSGSPITSEYVKQVLTERIGADTRVTILGHVQRGGSPSAFERYMATMVGCAAVDVLLAQSPESEPQLIGIREHKVVQSPLMDCVAKTHQVAQEIKAQNFETAMQMRGGSFTEAYANLQVLVRAEPHAPTNGNKSLRLALMHAGGPASGMNTAARVAVRAALDQGHRMFGVQSGFRGLIDGAFEELDWMSVSGWVIRGGAELGTSRYVPTEADFARIAHQLESHEIDGLLMIGGLTGYEAVYAMYVRREQHPAFNMPVVCLPASINNNLPGSEHSIGADTALNNIVEDVDKIKQSAVATQRCFVVEVMGHDCGYLAMMSGIGTGAERVYLPEDGITLADLQRDVEMLVTGFQQGKKLGLMIRNEHADALYTTEFMCSLFEKEGGQLFDVRPAILGHIQQGGDPSPYDRIQATRMAAYSMTYLMQAAAEQHGEAPYVCIGLQSSRIGFTSMADFPILMEPDAKRPRHQWWRKLADIARVMAQPTAPTEPTG